jgi:molybdenum cofactor cytidylyltransferase
MSVPAPATNLRRSHIAGIVLAAGLSRRFGDNKLLAPLDGLPLVRHVVAAALASRLERVVIVLGHQGARVRAALADLLDGSRCSAIVNGAYRDGQSGSVIAGLDVVRHEFPAAMFLMGDQPRLDAAIIDALVAAHEVAGTDICYPSRNGMRRNPVIFGRRFYPDILALSGDTGARAVIDANLDAATAVAFADGLPFRDVDRGRDLAALDEGGV